MKAHRGLPVYDSRHQTLRLSADVVAEMQAQGVRLDRSMSWIAQRAWKIAKRQLKDTPPAPPRTT